MLSLMWNLSATIHRPLRSSMPTNIPIDLLRTPRGLNGQPPWPWSQSRAIYSP